MYMKVVTALKDASGKDITGKVVPMPAGTSHFVSELDIGYFRSHPDVFSVAETDISPAAFATDASGNVTGLVGPDGTEYDLDPTYTWSGKPAAAGNTGVVIRVTDVGHFGTNFVSDGSNWHPVNGQAVIAADWGSEANPLATYTGGTGAIYTLPKGAIVIPAGLLVAGKTQIEVRAKVRRTTNTATANFLVKLGTNGTVSDGDVFAAQMAATTNLALHATPYIGMRTATEAVSTNYLSFQAAGASASAIERVVTTDINTAAAMTLSFGIGSANAADNFSLIGYAVTLVAG